MEINAYIPVSEKVFARVPSAACVIMSLLRKMGKIGCKIFLVCDWLRDIYAQQSVRRGAAEIACCI